MSGSISGLPEGCNHKCPKCGDEEYKNFCLMIEHTGEYLPNDDFQKEWQLICFNCKFEIKEFDEKEYGDGLDKCIKRWNGNLEAVGGR